MAKSAPWPLLHRDNLLAKGDILLAVLRRPTQTHFIAGPLVKMRLKKLASRRNLKNF